MNQQVSREYYLPMKKSVYYSQNFLKSAGLVEEIVGRFSLSSEDIVYEIGPGKGIITGELAKRCKKVIAVEADRELCLKLKRRFSVGHKFAPGLFSPVRHPEFNSGSTCNKKMLNRVQHDGKQHETMCEARVEPKIEILSGDFLSYKLPDHDYKIFSNIPFNITADILRKITETKTPPVDAFLIVQKEAAVKYAGAPYGKESLSSILVKPWFELTIVHTFFKKDFLPVPRVDIVLLRLKLRERPLVDIKNKPLFNDFFAYVFQQRESTVKEGLRDIFTNIQFSVLRKRLGFSPRATLTELSFPVWLEVFNYFLAGVNTDKKGLVVGSFQKLQNRQTKLRKIHRTRTDKNWKRKFIPTYSRKFLREG
ncbi:MAG: rRNA adenine dimethyltransferase family protein [bacterium]|nr:rRNA adenine dimethyltransferase family protein [bacterium]